MPETDTCTCGGATREQNGETTEAEGRYIKSSLIGAQLPDALAEALGDSLGTRRVDNLDEWVDEIRRRTDDAGEAIGVDDLCHVEGGSPHWGEIDGERYHFRCFYDAVVLSALVDEPVDIRTETPEGETVEMRADGTEELEVEPASAVFSFGISDVAVAASEGDPDHGDMYGAVCPNVRAFADVEEYERWDEEVGAVTVAAPLEGATELAEALVE